MRLSKRPLIPALVASTLLTLLTGNPLPLMAKEVPVRMAEQPSTAAFDSLLSPHFKADEAGASVLVMKDGKKLYAKGFGLASLELKVPNDPALVYRIGSVTKQFTAAAIMTLVEDGKVALDAPVSRYLDGLPEAWRPVTVQQLLTHTSGIPSYTNGPEYGAHMREDLPGLKLLETLVWTKPMDFAPGTTWKYNNSGYYLLGLIVEKASGKSYAEYLNARFFGPLGLTHTRYGTETELIPGMAPGYSDGKPAPYLSMGQPYAAGSLVSTAEDLARWTLALHAGKVVKPESLKLMTTPVKTTDGKEHPYGFGLSFRQSQGHRLVGHGGGINGYVCFLEADPATRAVAVVLCNTDGPKVNPEYLSRRLLALAAGTPIVEPTAIPVAPEKLARLAGTYQHEGFQRTIGFDKGRLTSQAAGGEAVDLIPLTELTFQLKGTDLRLRFELSGNEVLGVRRQAEGEPEGDLAKKVVAEAGPVAKVDATRFEALAGTYQLAPSFEIRVWQEGGRFFAQATGQGPLEIFAESDTHYFLKVVEAQLDFVKGPDGKAESLILTQGGRKMPGKRVK
ncbi:serine hydrolase [Geothrix sp. PMB-07]|uniref:serine hydrolase n=1 Tax=Geothrix sp. PMB-07 TaxID=3068640 RepID=UPI0027412FFC|nr:serine hydrolase [Geothrix sp. PMB-07]WLT30831.1 serine hydrolase [Geothrix sp. PMB-07]